MNWDLPAFEAAIQAERASAEALLATAVKEIRCDRINVQGFPTAFCQTGEEYTVICHDGVREQGRGFSSLPLSADVAVSRWKSEITRYLAGHPGTVYWRIEPEIAVECYLPAGSDGKATGKWEPFIRGIFTYSVYSRLCASTSNVIAMEVD